MKQEEAGPSIESYLRELRAGLVGVPPDAADEFVREIRAHVLERASTNAGGLDALASLGEAADLAKEYRAQMSVAQITQAPHPWGVLRATLDWARVSVWGAVGFAIAAVGYLAGAVVFLCALAKPLYPEAVGLWVLANRAMLGLLVESDAGHRVFGVSFGLWPPSFVIGTAGRLEARPEDVLGFWVVPIAVVVGLLTFYWTTRLVRRMAAEAVRSSREPVRRGDAVTQERKTR